MKVNSDVRFLVHLDVEIGVTVLCTKERCCSVQRYFLKIWARHKDGSARSTAAYCCDLVTVFVTTTVSADMKNMGSGLIKGTEMVLNAIKIILVYWCYMHCHPLMKRVK